MSETGKEYGELLKQQKNDRFDRFVANVLPKLRQSEFVVNIEDSNGCFIATTNGYGVIDIYPKANKIRIRQQNRWIKPIAPWLNKHLL